MLITEIPYFLHVTEYGGIYSFEVLKFIDEKREGVIFWEGHEIIKHLSESWRIASEFDSEFILNLNSEFFAKQALCFSSYEEI